MRSVFRFGLMFALLFGFWILLSGRLDAMHLGLGLLCSLLVALFSHELIRNPQGLGPVFTWFIPFLGWLIYEIIMANIEVARQVIHPRMPISPGIIKFRTDLKSDMALTTLANSITLTPGTMTIDIVGSDFYIHCLTIEDEEKVIAKEREFERQVKRLFGERRTS